MVIARVFLFFSFNYREHDYSCAFVNSFIPTDEKPDDDTGMWTVELDYDGQQPIFQVINVNSIAHGAHLFPFMALQEYLRILVTMTLWTGFSPSS